MNTENNELLFPTDADDLLLLQEGDEADDSEEMEMDFEEIEGDDLFDDPYIYLAILYRSSHGKNETGSVRSYELPARSMTHAGNSYERTFSALAFVQE